MKTLLALILLAFVAACATTAQLQGLQADVEQRLDGSITQEEFARRNRERDERLEAERLEQEAAAVGVVEALTGGAGIAASLYAIYRKTKGDAFKEVNAARDRARIGRGEQTGADETS